MQGLIEDIKRKLISWNSIGDPAYPLFYQSAYEPEVSFARVRIYFRDEEDNECEIVNKGAFVATPVYNRDPEYIKVLKDTLEVIRDSESIAEAIKSYIIGKAVPAVEDLVDPPSKSNSSRTTYAGSILMTLLMDPQNEVYCTMDDGTYNDDFFEVNQGQRILDSVRDRLEGAGFRGFTDRRLVPEYTDGTELFYLEPFDDFKQIRIRMGVVIGTKIVVSRERRTGTARLEAINQISYYVKPYPLNGASYSHPDTVSIRLTQDNLFLTEEDARASILLDSKL